MTNAIEASSLSIGYKNRETISMILPNLDLTVEEGCFLSILGSSGCGKSTLLRVLSDLLNPLSGTVKIFGEAPSAIRNRGEIGFVFQDATLLSWRTVQQNINLPLEIGHKNRSANSLGLDELLHMLRIDGLEQRYISQLSGGQRQRVAIARALITSPRLLLMDEPFGALDEITRDHLNDELLQIWRKTKITIIFVTHSIAEAAYLGQRVLVMASNPGRVILDKKMRSNDAIPQRDDPLMLDAMRELRSALTYGNSSF